MRILVQFNQDGSIRYLESPGFDLTDLGEATTRRASHIWPEGRAKRFVFRLLRGVFGERGKVATWTRGWVGPWQVRLASDASVVVYRHQSRRACLAWERAHLEATVLAA